MRQLREQLLSLSLPEGCRRFSVNLTNNSRDGGENIRDGRGPSRN